MLPSAFAMCSLVMFRTPAPFPVTNGWQVKVSEDKGSGKLRNKRGAHTGQIPEDTLNTLTTPLASLSHRLLCLCYPCVCLCVSLGVLTVCTSDTKRARKRESDTGEAGCLIAVCEKGSMCVLDLCVSPHAYLHNSV
jgi:hypothetical protein